MSTGAFEKGWLGALTTHIMGDNAGEESKPQVEAKPEPGEQINIKVRNAFCLVFGIVRSDCVFVSGESCFARCAS